MSETLLSALLWGIAGLLLGVSNIWLQNLSLKHAGKMTDKKLLTEFSLFSILRVVFALVFLFFAFRNGLAAGLSCLSSFIVTRWVGLAIFLVKNKERSE